MGHVAERHDANWHRDWDRRHAHFFHNRFFVFDDGFWFGLDAGFYPWDYLPYYADDYYPYDYYADDQPYDNTEPVDNGVPAADATVQAVQTQLTRLAITTVQSTASSDRQRVTRWRSTKSPTS